MTLTSRSFPAQLLAVTLAGAVLFSGCAKILASWPTVISIAKAIGNLAAVADPALAGISDLAVTELNNLQTLYLAYKAHSTADTKAALVAAINTIQENLPLALATAHIKDPALVIRVTAAINLILDFVDSIAVQIPGGMAAKTQAKRAARGVGKIPALPSRAALVKRWDSQVCYEDAACMALVK